MTPSPKKFLNFIFPHFGCSHFRSDRFFDMAKTYYHRQNKKKLARGGVKTCKYINPVVENSKYYLGPSTLYNLQAVAWIRVRDPSASWHTGPPININEITSRTHKRDPEYWLLSEELYPVRKDQQQILIFCTFRGIPDPRDSPAQWGLRGPYLHHCLRVT